MNLKIVGYTAGHDAHEEGLVMSKRKMPLNKGAENFGARLTRLRQAAGYSLREFAAEVGISHRMVVYYEKHAEHPPAHLLPQLAKALGVSTDQLLGVEKEKPNGRVRDSRLWRRFSQVEQLPPAQRKPIIQLLDAFLQRTPPKRG